jgi:hypothetical protein
MKEFIEQLKPYKEYVLLIIGIVGGCLFVINYFATKEALANTTDALNKALANSQATLNRLIEERECWLNNRITVAEVSAGIGHLEREKIQKTSLKLDLLAKVRKDEKTPTQLAINEQLGEIVQDMKRIDEDLKNFRFTQQQLNVTLYDRTCSKLK